MTQSGPTIVGIGTSAGGLAALKNFLHHVPENSGLAFVVVIHLSPTHESHLAELLQQDVRMPVLQVVDTIKVEANHVYVIPPNANLNAIDTHLRLSELEKKRHDRAPIDHFFRTLADAHDGHSVAVILTGTGSDGTLGVKDIKAKGGLVVVQEPKEAEYDGMPRSAIGTGLADFILPVAEIPAAILQYDHTQPRVATPKEDQALSESQRVLLQNVFALLRARTNRDFGRYKPSTVLRRIARRMQINYTEDLQAYLEKLRERPEEARALSDDLLITITHFFRDADVFETLETEILPALFKRKNAQAIRAWSVGCATGEEAYSLAILFAEAMARSDSRSELQVFASDLHGPSLARAREGLYPGDISLDVNLDRLDRFFQKEDGVYRVQKEIRDMVVFAQHNILSDPPFSKMDLISCRNLMIYLERDVQRDVIELFHYALNPDGVLLLGSAESIDTSDLFSVEHKKACLYRKRNIPARDLHLPVFPVTRIRFPDIAKSFDDRGAEPIVYGDVHLQMVEKYAPPSILVSPDNKVVHLSAHAGRYLLHSGGAPTTNVLQLVREEMRLAVQSALQQAREKRKPVDSDPIPVRFNGTASPVVIHTRPAREPDRDGYVLIIFEERAPQDPAESIAADAVTSAEALRIRELEAELAAAKRHAQAIIQSYEASQEEMKATGEEMQSMNEELRSTLEELETSKEEMQSVNEELQTVNQQNRYKVEELNRLTSDLQNLLSATEIATLFLDRDLSILRFTPKLGELFNVRLTDRGRRLSDYTHRLGYPDLGADAETVLRRLIPVEREVKDEAGRWYLTRLLPYRSTEDVIEGVVITFIDIDSRKQAETELQEVVEQLRVANESLSQSNDELAASRSELATLTARLLSAQEKERRRIASELHDNLNQKLAMLEVDAGRLIQKFGSSPEIEAEMAALRTRIGGITNEIRNVAYQLYPSVLSHLGLKVALQNYCREFSQTTGIEVNLDAEDVGRLQEDVALCLYRVAQEGLWNVAKHSSAKAVEVFVHASSQDIHLALRDDGVGFDVAASRAKGLGLPSMRERVRDVNGKLTLTSAPGEGTQIDVWIPHEGE